MALKNNTWTLNQWYDQDVAGNVNYISDGMLFIWGVNQNGQLGLNQADSVKVSSPTEIPGAWDKLFPTSGANAPSKGGSKTSGSLWTWGTNNEGQLGQNSRTYYSSPVQIPGTTWSSSASRANVKHLVFKEQQEELKLMEPYGCGELVIMET